MVIQRIPSKDGIRFFTPDEFSQQVAYMARPKNYEIPAHRHNFYPRKILWTSEVLIIKSGRVKVTFYDEKKIAFRCVLLKKSDIILLVQGAHGFKMLARTEMIEIKQGPYAQNKDKTLLFPSALPGLRRPSPVRR
ncbi:MAG: hypothetical protein ACO3CL_09090 [Bacteroidia bacterium]